MCIRDSTGRTHQIRVHLEEMGCPIVGDKLYGAKIKADWVPKDRFFLHAWKLAFPHPRSGEIVSFRSFLPHELIAAPVSYTHLDVYKRQTEEVMRPILESSGLQVERDFYLCHSPERVDPGNKRYTTCNTNKIVGAVGPESLEVALAFYSQTIRHVVPVSSARVAELVKVYENTFRAVNICLLYTSRCV